MQGGSSPLLKRLGYLAGLILLLLLMALYLPSGSAGSGAGAVASDSVAVAADGGAQRAPTLSGSVWKVVWVTLILLVIIIIALRGYAAAGRKAFGSDQMRILARYPIGQRQYLLLVAVEGRKMLLGITEQSINFLANLGEADEPPEGGDVAPGGYSFSTLLKRLQQVRSDVPNE